MPPPSSPAGGDGNDTDGHVETPGSSSSNTLMLLATSATEATKDLVPTSNQQFFNLQQDTRQVITEIYGWRSRLLDTASIKFLKAYQDFLHVYPEWGQSIAALELVKTYEPSSSDEEDEVERDKAARISFRSESSSSPRLKRNRREWATFRCRLPSCRKGLQFKIVHPVEDITDFPPEVIGHFEQLEHYKRWERYNSRASLPVADPHDHSYSLLQQATGSNLPPIGNCSPFSPLERTLKPSDRTVYTAPSLTQEGPHTSTSRTVDHASEPTYDNALEDDIAHQEIIPDASVQSSPLPSVPSDSARLNAVAETCTNSTPTTGHKRARSESTEQNAAHAHRSGGDDLPADISQANKRARLGSNPLFPHEPPPATPIPDASASVEAQYRSARNLQRTRETTDYTADTMEALILAIDDMQTADGPSLAPFLQPGVVDSTDEAMQYLDRWKTQVDGEVQIKLDYTTSTLLPIQLAAVASLWKSMESSTKARRGMLLADGVGLGKTLVALSVIIKDMKVEGQGADPVRTMIFCPDGLEEVVWLREIRLRTPSLLQYTTVVRDAEAWTRVLEDKKSTSRKSKIVIITFSFVRRFVGRDSTLSGGRIDLDDFEVERVIVDEVHKARNPAHVLSQRIAKTCVKSTFTLLLSATPLIGSATDIFMPLVMMGIEKGESLDVELADFKRGAPKRNKGPESLRQIYDWIIPHLQDRNIYMARGRDDPACRTVPRFTPIGAQGAICRPASWEADAIQVLRDHFEDAFKRHVLFLWSKYQQILNIAADLNEPIPPEHELAHLVAALNKAVMSWPEAIDYATSETYGPAILHSDEIDFLKRETSGRMTCKTQALCETLTHNSKVAPDDKVLIVTGMESNLDAIVMAVEKAGYKRWQSYRQVQPDKNGVDEYLPGYYVCYAPSLSRGENTRALLDLEDRTEVKLIIGLTDALMEGKNLHMCNHLYMMDIPRSQQQVQQLQGRILRYPQNKRCIIKRFMTRNTLDEVYDGIVLNGETSLGHEYAPTISFNDISRHFGYEPMINRWINHARETAHPLDANSVLDAEVRALL